MNERFLELPEEKRAAIINAAMEVFGQNEYKKASTDDIAAKAGISKGLLFYYFHNKKSIYLYLVELMVGLIRKQMNRPQYQQCTDFFEVLEKGGEVKIKIMAQFPFLKEFAMRAYYSQIEGISEAVHEVVQEQYAHLGDYFKNVNFNKFKEDVDPMELMNMLFWMADGYVRQLELERKPLDLKEMMAQFDRWSEMFKKMAYKEEYL